MQCSYSEKQLKGEMIREWIIWVGLLKMDLMKYHFSLAMDWYKQSDLKDNPDGMHNYEFALELGFDGLKDLTQAFRWYQVAAEKGQKRTWNKLGDAFLKGWQCEKSLEATAYWFKNINFEEFGFHSNDFCDWNEFCF
jgi:TPR repeat protein